MMRMGSILGLATSLAVMFSAYTGAPEASVAEAQTTAAPSDGCVTREVALDEGYGVTRTEKRVFCSADQEK